MMMISSVAILPMFSLNWVDWHFIQQLNSIDESKSRGRGEEIETISQERYKEKVNRSMCSITLSLFLRSYNHRNLLFTFYFESSLTIYVFIIMYIKSYLMIKWNQIKLCLFNIIILSFSNIVLIWYAIIYILALKLSIQKT